MHPGHGSAHGHGHVRFGHGSRARRGDVQVAVLALLREQDMHGYQIIQELSDRSGGAWSPSPGSVYPTLQMLEDQGMVKSERVGGKRVFSLTDLGRTHAEQIPEGAPWASIAEESDPERRLRESFLGLVSAATQVARAGSPEQVEQAADIVADARKRIYTILAG